MTEWLYTVFQTEFIVWLIEGALAIFWYREYKSSKNGYFLVLSKISLGFLLLNIFEFGVDILDISNKYLRLGIDSLIFTIGIVLAVTLFFLLPCLMISSESNKYWVFAKKVATPKGIVVITTFSALFVLIYTLLLIT